MSGFPGWNEIEAFVAHSASLRGSAAPLSVPTWLILLTGGGVVGASFLLATFATDRTFVATYHERRFEFHSTALAVAGRVAPFLGGIGLLWVIASGFLGPGTPQQNPAVLVVWVGWWSGLAMVSYLLGDAWRALNPLSAIAKKLPQVADLDFSGFHENWIPAIGLLGLVFVEVVSPLADDPSTLSIVIVLYIGVALGGSLLFGASDWFESLDPISKVFSAYGTLAPIGQTDEGYVLRWPGAALTGTNLENRFSVPFVVALVWVTTYDGLVTTPTWRDFATGLASAGVSALSIYFAVLLTGFIVFYLAFTVATRFSKRLATTYRDLETMKRRFAAPLVAIAAGYHLAHFLEYFLTLSPALWGVITHPVSGPPAPVAIVLPGWFDGLRIAFVLIGHLLAIWIAHAIAFDLFPSRLQAIRSQYPVTAIMIAYTTLSLWIVTAPTLVPPLL